MIVNVVEAFKKFDNKPKIIYKLAYSSLMSIGILGKKLGMSQLFDEDGNAVPVTLIEAGPCRVSQLKTQPLEGYTAIQIGYGVSKDKHLSKPEKGHLLKSGEILLKHLKEYRVEENSSYEIGKEITVTNF